MRPVAMAIAAAAAALASCTADPAAAPISDLRSPQAAVEELLAADRAYAQASAEMELADGLAAMFDDETIMPVPTGFARGRDAIVAALNANPLDVGARATWTPVRGGIAADGDHGFTIGYMTITSAGKPDRNAKYVAFWIRRPAGWRVAVYKRNGRPDGPVPLDVMPASLPEASLEPSSDAAILAAYRASLDKAERDFSDDAQVMGIGPAFVKHGRPDATNIGAGAPFAVGNERIGADVASFGGPPPTWAPDGGVIVASTGDFGITWGMIRPRQPAEGQRAAIPYTTVWRRASPQAPWRYVAE